MSVNCIHNTENITDRPVHKLKPKVGDKYKLLIPICGLVKHRLQNDGVKNNSDFHHFVLNA